MNELFLYICVPLHSPHVYFVQAETRWQARQLLADSLQQTLDDLRTIAVGRLHNIKTVDEIARVLSEDENLYEITS